MEKQNQIVKEVRNRVQAIVPDARIILYGSRARGDVREDSDWDFLVVLDKLNSSLEKELLQSIYDYELLSRQPISVFITTKDQVHLYKMDPFYQSVSQEGLEVTKTDSRIEEPDNDCSYSLTELVLLRLKKADQAFADAQRSNNQESFSLAINRLYYTAFYAVTACQGGYQRSQVAYLTNSLING